MLSRLHTAWKGPCWQFKDADCFPGPYPYHLVTELLRTLRISAKGSEKLQSQYFKIPRATHSLYTL